MKEIVLHVRDFDAFFADARDMARRLDRGQARSAPARFAFESMEGLLKVLTANRWAPSPIPAAGRPMETS